MASIYTSAQFMFEDSDTNLDERISREEFEGQATARTELTKRNSAQLWSTYDYLQLDYLHRSHYLILMGTNDVANLRILVRQRFTLAAETWNASNPNNDDKVTTAEFQEFLLHDYGIDHLVSILLWRNVDSE